MMHVMIPLVRHFLKKRAKILQMAKRYATPFYCFDKEELENSIRKYASVFKKYLPGALHHYAIKSNYHQLVVRTVLQHGFGLDVSSGLELKMAISKGAKRIVFSGPGKTIPELELAIKHHARVIVHLDSFNELKKLAVLAKRRNKKIQAGVRFFTTHHGAWNKFGIPLEELAVFWKDAKKYAQWVQLSGFQFHISHALDPNLYAKIIQKLAKHLAKEFSPSMLQEIKFIDIGGGYMPYQTQGEYHNRTNREKYYMNKTVPLERYALTISQAINKYLRPLVRCRFFTEPGRIISTGSMHIVLRAVDIKKENRIILDGGMNIEGWEYGEAYYFPMINFSHPSSREISAHFYGPLCTPHDIWGYHCYSKTVREGDVIFIPNQGAYRYSMAQKFIKPIPRVYLPLGSRRAKR